MERAAKTCGAKVSTSSHSGPNWSTGDLGEFEMVAEPEEVEPGMYATTSTCRTTPRSCGASEDAEASQSSRRKS